MEEEKREKLSGKKKTKGEEIGWEEEILTAKGADENHL